MYSVIDKNIGNTMRLIESGASLNAKDASGNAPLHFATQGWDVALAEILLENGAEVDAQDKYGNTPLSNAVFYSEGHGQLIVTLLRAGANKDLKNAAGVSPLSLARSIGNFDLVRFFE